MSTPAIAKYSAMGGQREITFLVVANSTTPVSQTRPRFERWRPLGTPSRK